MKVSWHKWYDQQAPEEPDLPWFNVPAGAKGSQTMLERIAHWLMHAA